MTTINHEIIVKHIKPGDFVAIQFHRGGTAYGKFIENDPTCFVITSPEADHIGVVIIDAETVKTVINGPCAEGMYKSATCDDEMESNIAEALRQHRLRQDMLG